MSVWLLIIIFLGMILVIIGSGTYVSISLACVGIIGLECLVGSPGMIGNVIFNAIWSYALFAVPLFVFMGEVILLSGISQTMYQGISKLTRIMPGGLLHSNIVTCSIFAAISGSSVATSATIGAVAYPEQKARGYSHRLITGSIATGGTLGVLIPPSIIMIIYGSITSVSVGRLFIGGIVPGILLSIMFMAYIFIITAIRHELGEAYEKVAVGAYFKDGIRVIKDMWPVLLILGSIFIGIYGGYMTPTESGAIAAFEALVIAAIFRKLNFNLLKKALLATLSTTSFVMFIIVGANILGVAVSMLKIPAQLCEKLALWDIDPIIIWFAIIGLYLIMGCFMESISLLLLTLPIIFPIAIDIIRMDPVVLGVMLVLLIECAMITPPLGMNVYVVHGVTGEENIMEVFKGCIPFVIIILIMIIILTFLPSLVLYLPNAAFGT